MPGNGGCWPPLQVPAGRSPSPKATASAEGAACPSSDKASTAGPAVRGFAHQSSHRWLLSLGANWSVTNRRCRVAATARVGQTMWRGQRRNSGPMRSGHTSRGWSGVSDHSRLSGLDPIPRSPAIPAVSDERTASLVPAGHPKLDYPFGTTVDDVDQKGSRRS
jgi:hypothetical protein